MNTIWFIPICLLLFSDIAHAAKTPHPPQNELCNQTLSLLTNSNALAYLLLYKFHGLIFMHQCVCQTDFVSLKIDIIISKISFCFTCSGDDEFIVLIVSLFRSIVLWWIQQEDLQNIKGDLWSNSWINYSSDYISVNT